MEVRVQATLKKNIPLLFLVVVSLWWSFYYQSNSNLNDFGAANFEWLFLLDGLLVLPLLCFMCIADKKAASLKALTYACLVIFIGSFIIPEQDKFIFSYLEIARYIPLTIFFLFEVTAIVTVFLAIKAALTNSLDPDLAVSESVTKLLGDGIVTSIVTFEARLWTYALFAKSINFKQFEGDKHFSYHSKDGAKSSSQGFIFLILMEAPILHVLLHFMWSPFAANIVSALTLACLVLLFSEYRAMSRRPISIDNANLVIRYGIQNPKAIAFSNIQSVATNEGFIAKSKSLKKYNFFGDPNVVIDLVEPDGDVAKIYLGVDEPNVFIDQINKSIS